ncbi:MAG: co-chaperone GroES [Candidatus Paceibacterota bacterium]|jgi:chaperonin GroES
MAKISIKPLGDRVLVEIKKEEDKTGKTKSGIIIPETVSKERPEEGVVVAVGEGHRLEDGTLMPVAVKKGQKVIFSKYGPDEVKIDDKEYLIVSESSILAVIED